MKYIILLISILLLATSAGAYGVVNNSGSLPADSLSIPFYKLNVAGNVEPLADVDSIFLIVFYPSGTIAYTDSSAYDGSQIIVQAYSADSQYVWRSAVADIDGSGVQGVYSYSLIVLDTAVDSRGHRLATPFSGEFQLLTGADFNVYMASIIESRDSMYTVDEKYAGLRDSLSRVLDSLYAYQTVLDSIQRAVSDAAKAQIAGLARDSVLQDSLHYQGAASGLTLAQVYDTLAVLLADSTVDVQALIDSLMNVQPGDTTADSYFAQLLRYASVGGTGESATAIIDTFFNRLSSDTVSGTYLAELYHNLRHVLDSIDVYGPRFDSLLAAATAASVFSKTLGADTSGSVSPGTFADLLSIAADSSFWADIANVWMNIDTSGVDSSGLGQWLINNLSGGATATWTSGQRDSVLAALADAAIRTKAWGSSSVKALTDKDGFTIAGTLQTLDAMNNFDPMATPVTILPINSDGDTLARVKDSATFRASTSLLALQSEVVNLDGWDPTVDPVIASPANSAGDTLARQKDSLSFQGAASGLTIPDILDSLFGRLVSDTGGTATYFSTIYHNLQRVLDSINVYDTRFDSLLAAAATASIYSKTIGRDTAGNIGGGTFAELLSISADSSFWADIANVWMNIDTSGVDTSGLGQWLRNNLAGGATATWSAGQRDSVLAALEDAAVAAKTWAKPVTRGLTETVTVNPANSAGDTLFRVKDSTLAQRPTATQIVDYLLARTSGDLIGGSFLSELYTNIGLCADSLGQYQAELDSVVQAIADVNKHNFMADVSGLASQDSLNIVLDSVRSLPAGVYAYFISGTNENVFKADTTGIMRELDSLGIFLGVPVGARSVTTYSGDVDTLKIYNGATLIRQVIYRHIGGTAGSSPDSTVTQGGS
jgi:hypothetical protein